MVALALLGDLLVGPLMGRFADRRGRGRLLGALSVVALIALLGSAWTRTLAAIAVSVVALFLSGTGFAAVLNSWAGDLA